MCGIFGIALKKSVPLDMVFKVLERLEVHQLSSEPIPVGGYGAGVAVLENDGRIVLEKVGKTRDSPVKHLKETMRVGEARVLIGHVRYPSPQFMETARFRETAQPYLADCLSGLRVVSVHNGFVENYQQIREGLSGAHVFGSDKVGFVDSEVVPHFFEQMLRESGSVDEALDGFFSGLDGNNTIGLLHVAGERVFLHLIHKGKTRGLRVWVNDDGEVGFCSRTEPLVDVFGDLLKKGKFREKVSIGWQENSDMKLSIPVSL